jgi:hypothetical protein
LAYIGVQPAEAYTSFAVQHFTTSATTSYTLDNAVANENEIALFINNVRQEPGSSYAYTASGTTLTLSAATSASDTMYCVFIGKAVQTVTPATGSVTNDMLDSTNQSFLKSIPQSGSAKTSSYTLTTSDLGSFIEVGSSGSITIPDATFSTGNAISLFNNTTGDITITCSITTAYISGTDADKSTVTLATRGIATILFISGTVCVISGNVS